MSALFAVSDPQTVLTSGNAIAILALIIVTLAGVVVYLARKIDKQSTDSSTEIKALNVQLLADSKQNALDYREMAKDNAVVLSGNSQNMALLSEKIEVVKGKR